MAETETDTRERLADFENSFAGEAPMAQLPAAVQQIIIDERPQGAMEIKVRRRPVQEILAEIKAVASAAGDDFFYSWTVNNKDGSRGTVEGPSVKCANAVVRIYGNASLKVRAFDQGAHWLFVAQFYDMQTGYVYERPFIQRKGQNVGGKMDKERAADIVFQIGASKAARNCVCNALSEFTDYAFDIAKEKLVEKIGKKLPEFRDRVRQRLHELRVEPLRVEKVRGKPLDAWTAHDMARTIAEIQSVNDGLCAADEVWPLAEAGQPRPQEADFTQAKADSGQQRPAERKPDVAAEVTIEQMVKGLEQAARSLAWPAPKGRDAIDHKGNDAAIATGEEDEDSPEAREFIRGERIIDERGGEGQDCIGTERDVVIVDGIADEVRDMLKGLQIDREDIAVLLGRWNTKVLERKRALQRRKR